RRARGGAAGRARHPLRHTGRGALRRPRHHRSGRTARHRRGLPSVSAMHPGPERTQSVPMASLPELARFHTRLTAGAITHLQRLAASWGLLADFCFADLLLFGVVGEPRADEPNRFVVLAQVRPTTAQTVYRADWVGTVLEEEDRPLVARCFRLGEIIEGESQLSPLKERIRVLAIPVRWRDRVVAVLTRESAPSFGRQPGELERTYVDVFHRFARMIANGDFP